MIGFSMMMWFVSIILMILGVLLLKGNSSGVHGSVYDDTDDKNGYARELAKPILLLAVGIAIAGIIAVVIDPGCSVIIAAGFILIVVIAAGIWFGKIQKRN